MHILSTYWRNSAVVSVITFLVQIQSSNTPLYYLFSSTSEDQYLKIPQQQQSVQTLHKQDK